MKKDEILALGADARVEKLAKAIEENKGVVPTASNKKECAFRSGILQDLPQELAKLNDLRQGNDKEAPVDLSLGEYMKERYSITPSANGCPEEFYKAIGIDPANTTLATLTSMGEIEPGLHSIIPEVIRENVRLGLRNQPIYRELIRSEEAISQMKLTMPKIKMSDAMPKPTGEMETISTGQMQFGSKDVKIKKMAIGISLSDEAIRYTSINMLSIFLEDVGVRFGTGLDRMAIETLLQGDQADGSDSVAVVGVGNTGSLKYADLLQIWIRMQTLGLVPSTMIMNEVPALGILQMEEFKLPSPQYAMGANPSGIPAPTLNFKTPLPQNQDVFINRAIPNNNYVMLLNKMNALIKLNATGLLVETERNASKQFSSFYVSQTTGFATLKRDARVVIDKSVAFSAQGFPTWMDISANEAE